MVSDINLPHKLLTCGLYCFGQARFGSARYCGDIQPYIYRAPEVLLRTTWDEKVDIWNLAVLIKFFDPEGTLSLTSTRPVTNQAIQGHWKGAAPIPSTTLEQREEILQGEEQQLFPAFMRKML
ncbi:Protein kinase-like domain [Penicillium roqueforti FM164]|uniref:Protein kinase-like domain n=1 Tax=Penicillium roqueforti (strain FM164) TaxID=1365484 RepID=W6Q0X0_PENRF|nr:Protein kinase-like domain [Penicillium roqueforti FM164]